MLDKLRFSLIKIYKNKEIGYQLLKPFIKTIRTIKNIRYRIMSDESFIKEKYKNYFGVKPDLNNPLLFTEKIQWMKLYDRKPIYTICADKFNVRQFVEERIGQQYLRNWNCQKIL
jgi:hypothetical protein